MSLDHKGFTAIEIIVVIVVVAMLGLAVWVLWQNQQSTPGEMSTSQPEENSLPQQGTGNTDVTTLEKGEIIEISDGPIELTESEDVDRLPAKTPESFKQALAQKLKNNKPNENNCVTVYTVTKISTVNIAGGVAYVNADTKKPSRECGSGAGVVWYKTGDSQWDSTVVTQSVLLCSTLKEKKIYKEFVEKCRDRSKGKIVPNPNGLLESVNT